MDFLPERLSEKLSVSFESVDMPVIPSYEYFVRIHAWERLVLSISFVSFLCLLGVFFI